MKKFLLTLTLMLIASPVFAGGTAGTAFNSQVQSQSLGGVSFYDMGGMSEAVQKQEGYGYSAAYPGSLGAEGQMQAEMIDHTFTNPRTQHTYQSVTMTSGGSVTRNGIAGHEETANTRYGTLTLGNGVGTQSLGTSGADVGTASASGALGNSHAATLTAINYRNSYVYTNLGPSSYQTHVGVTYGKAGTRTKTAFVGLAGAEVRGTQAGATYTANDGQGGAMYGVSESHGKAEVATGVLGNGTAHGYVNQGQIHAYEQASYGPGTSQYQTGYTATQNKVHE